jgi:putative Holliday junction resolvase
MGLALSDEGGRLATPLRVVEVASPAQAARLAAQAAQKHHAEQLLVGLPLNIDGSAGPAAAGALAWGKSLARLCHLPLIFVDERLSSFTADQWLVDQKRSGRHITRKGKKKRQDALAAADFLQGFLDGRLPPITAGSIAPG